MLNNEQSKYIVELTYRIWDWALKDIYNLVGYFILLIILAVIFAEIGWKIYKVTEGKYGVISNISDENIKDKVDIYLGLAQFFVLMGFVMVVMQLMQCGFLLQRFVNK